tara:strand:- start:99 stop:389 length:291 start_codon:yes stop_codon:yes gene_type:complete
MKKIFFLILLLILPMGNLGANENNKFYSPVVELYEKTESKVVNFFNDIMDKSVEENLNLNFNSIEQPLTKGFDFVCYNSCKERNDEGFCMQQCSLK